jgi:hypothetical protein
MHSKVHAGNQLSNAGCKAAFRQHKRISFTTKTTFRCVLGVYCYKNNRDEIAAFVLFHLVEFNLMTSAICEAERGLRWIPFCATLFPFVLINDSLKSIPANRKAVKKIHKPSDRSVSALAVSRSFFIIRSKINRRFSNSVDEPCAGVSFEHKSNVGYENRVINLGWYYPWFHIRL